MLEQAQSAAEFRRNTLVSAVDVLPILRFLITAVVGTRHVIEGDSY